MSHFLYRLQKPVKRNAAVNPFAGFAAALVTHRYQERFTLARIIFAVFHCMLMLAAQEQEHYTA